MNSSLIFNISNDFITIATGIGFRSKPVILCSLTRNYDKLFTVDGKTINPNFLYKELRSMLEELFNKKVPVFDDVFVIIPDIKSESIAADITAYTNSPTSIISGTDIKNLFNSVEKKHSNDPTKKPISITPVSFETDAAKFLKAPINETSAYIKMNYLVYAIDQKFYDLILKIFAKLGIKNPIVSLNAVEMVNLIKISTMGENNLMHYFLIDSSYTKTQFSIIGDRTNFFNVDLEFDFSDLVEDFVHEYDIAYADAKNLILDYGYDAKKHPVKILLYQELNNLDVEVKIFQSDLNERIDAFIDEFAKRLLEKEVALSEMAFLDHGVKLPIIGIGELFKINGFKKRLEQKLQREITIFNNKYVCSESRNFYPIISAIDKLEEFRYESEERKKEPFVNVTRGE